VEDVAVISSELTPDFDPEDVLNLPSSTIYLKRMIKGSPSRLSAVTLRPGDLEGDFRSGP